MDKEFYETRIQFLREFRQLLLRFNASINIETSSSSQGSLEIEVDGRECILIDEPVTWLDHKRINKIVSDLIERSNS